MSHDGARSSNEECSVPLLEALDLKNSVRVPIGWSVDTWMFEGFNSIRIDFANASIADLLAQYAP